MLRVCSVCAVVLVVSAYPSLAAFGECGADHWKCGDGQCIPKTGHCDTIMDCKDGSDEMDCFHLNCTPPEYFRCNNGHCISSREFCDGVVDCPDGSDEPKTCSKDKEHLEAVHEETCSTDEFRCADNSCIKSSWICDDEPDCLDGSDETIGCHDQFECIDGFRCKNRHCIIKEFQCDGYDDCGDNSDEDSCSTVFHSPDNCPVGEGFFLCEDKIACIEERNVCDNITHCFDGSDEMGCSVNRVLNETHCKALGCSHSCHLAPHGMVNCTCQKGYKLKPDGKTCTDINECEEFGFCHQRCKNLNGSYECSCDNMYILQPDNRTCKAAGGEALLLFSSLNHIRGIYLPSELYFTVTKNVNTAIGVSHSGHHVYWTDTSHGEVRIVRATESGSDMEILVDSGLGIPEDLVVDYVTHNIYFTDKMKRHIGVCSETGVACTVLHNKDIHKPRAIALYPQKGLMYWSDWGEIAMIVTSGMDGSNPKPLVTENLKWPNGLALDISNDRLYWVDAKERVIETIRLDGSDRRVVLRKPVKHPFSLALFEDTLYWSDWDSRDIQKCNKFTGANHSTVAKEKRGKNYIYGVHIYHSALQPRVSNPCLNHRCSHVCLLSPNSSYACACPEHYTLGADMHTCRLRSKTLQIAVGADNKIFLTMPLHIGRQSTLEVRLDDVGAIGCMAYDSVSGSIIVSDVFRRKLYRLSLQTKEVFVLINSGLGHISSMSFDSYGNNLYLTDTTSKRVDVFSMRTRTLATVYRLHNGDVPESIVVISELGIFFIAVLHVDGSIAIAKVNMDGTGVIPNIIGNSIHGPKISLAYDKRTKKVYWSDSEDKIIESIHVDGTGREIVHLVGETPISVVVENNHVFWVASDSNILYNIDTTMDAKERPEFAMAMAMDKEDYPTLIVIGETESTLHHPCHNSLESCSHVCLVSFGNQRTCLCPIGMQLGSDNRTCHSPAHCSENQFKCRTDEMCIAKIHRCDGHIDCPSGDDENDCNVDNCRSDQFKCTNGQCIAAGKRCDGEHDCSDHSDEFSCSSNCTDNQFQCGSGDCIPSTWRCDGSADCRDSSDERQCGIEGCKANYFHCKSGMCIPQSWECDGEPDCPDGSDEHERCIPPTCRTGEMRCNSGRCIASSMICDGAQDCEDGADESSCDKHDSEVVCFGDEFLCSISKTKCVPRMARCNGTAECPRGEDEMDCSNCQLDEFRCSNMKCINIKWVCDGEDDCGDHSDENPHLCSPMIKPQQTAEAHCSDFRCRSGECIPLYLACNGFKNCADNSDEGPNCASACSSSTCQQGCIATPEGGRCSCGEGFRLNSDGYTCTDIDECAEQRCSQLCVNTPGSFRCSCLPDFLLKSDKLTCKAMGEPLVYILSSDDEIRNISHDFRNLHLLSYSPGSQISGFDLDARRGIIYWSTGSNHRINMMNVSSTEKNFVMGSGQPGKLSLDWVTGNIYYIDNSDFTSIKACQMSERKYADIIQVDPGFIITHLIFNPVSGILYYSKARPSTMTRPSSHIMELTASDSNSTVLVAGNVSWVSGFAIDHIRQYLYWSDLYHQIIEKVRLDGSDRQIVFKENVHRPEGLVLFEDHLFWLTKGSGIIKKCILYGSLKGSCETIQQYYDLKFLAIMQKAYQPNVTNPCRDRCDPYALCVLSAYGPKCICEDGTVLADKASCGASNMILSHEVMSKYSEGNLRRYVSHVHENAPASGNSTAVIGILITALIICTAFASYLYVKKRRSGVVLETMHFQNPSFGLSHVESSYHPSELTPGEHQYENPTEKLVKHPDGKYGVITHEKETEVKTNCRLELHDYDSDSDVEDRMDLKAKLIP